MSFQDTCSEPQAKWPTGKCRKRQRLTLVLPHIRMQASMSVAELLQPMMSDQWRRMMRHAQEMVDQRRCLVREKEKVCEQATAIVATRERSKTKAGVARMSARSIVASRPKLALQVGRETTRCRPKVEYCVWSFRQPVYVSQF